MEQFSVMDAPIVRQLGHLLNIVQALQYDHTTDLSGTELEADTVNKQPAYTDYPNIDLVVG